jgi:hypothetical protein
LAPGSKHDAALSVARFQYRAHAAAAMFADINCIIVTASFG